MAIYSYDHGAVERNHIYSLDSHGKHWKLLLLLIFIIMNIICFIYNFGQLCSLLTINNFWNYGKSVK